MPGFVVENEKTSAKYALSYTVSIYILQSYHGIRTVTKLAGAKSNATAPITLVCEVSSSAPRLLS